MGDVALGQRTQPQQVRELVRIDGVGLDPLALAHRLHPVRVRQVRLEPRGLQRINSPVPAIGRLDRDRCTAAGRTDRLHQRLRVVVDLHAVQLLALAVDPADHRPMQMKIHSHKLLLRDTVAHGGLHFYRVL